VLHSAQFLICSFIALALSQIGIAPSLAQKSAVERNDRVIVVFSPSAEKGLEAWRRHTQNMCREFKARWCERGLTIEHPLWIIDGAIVSGPRSMLVCLRDSEGIRAVYPNERLRIPDRIKTLHPLRPGTVTWALRSLGALTLWNDHSLRGQGMRIGIIDTGIDDSHPDLAGKTVLWQDFVNGKQKPYDDNGHGSHCAGSIAGGAQSGTAIGLAPEAQLVVAKAIAANGQGSSTDMLLALQWIADPDGDPTTRDAPTVISNSWGGRSKEYYRTVIRRLLSLDIVPCFSCGNSGPGVRSVLQPASFEESLTVTAIDSFDSIARFASRGPVFFDDNRIVKPDIAAPGVDIYSAKAGGGYISHDGTSMACPHVAAAVALIRQAEPILPVSAVRWLIATTARELGTTGVDNTFGAGAISPLAIIELLGTNPLICGKVLSSDTDEPIDAKLHILGITIPLRTWALDHGSFALPIPPEGMTVDISSFGFQTTRVILVPDTSSAETIIRLTAVETGRLYLKVQDAANQLPVAGVSVKILDTPLASAETDSRGSFSCSLPLGSYDLQLWKRGIACRIINDVSIEAENTTTLTVAVATTPSILLVDDDEGKRYEQYFERALSTINRPYDLRRTNKQLTLLDLRPYETIVWFTGQAKRNVLTSDDRENIDRYVSEGGAVLMTGQNLAASLRFSPFLRKTLSARFARDSVDSREIRGLSSPLQIEGGDGADNQNSPDRLNARDGAEELLSYWPIGGTAAVHGSGLGGSTILLGFGFEGIAKARDRAKTMAELLELLE